MEDRLGLQVASVLRRFVDEEVLPGTEISSKTFWAGLESVVERFTERNRALLRQRGLLQRQIDQWHRDHPADQWDPAAYESFLRSIGYLVDEGPAFIIDVADVDAEICDVAGPQLVVPVTNARYALNAVNARWGSLYDAVYGTDALGDPPPAGPYDPDRGRRVVAWVRSFVDERVPLRDGSHAEAVAYRVVDRHVAVELADGRRTGLRQPAQFVGYRGPPNEPEAILLTNNGLRIEFAVDRRSEVGAADPAGIADVMMEAAVTVIMDLEDSVATVDAVDKVEAYRNWLGLMRGDLTANVVREGTAFTRRMADDREYLSPEGRPGTLPGRGLMLIRNVGHHLTTTAVRDSQGREVFEGLVDLMVTVACSLHDVRGQETPRNSRTGSVYVVKPKMHGPAEVAFANDLFDHVEQLLDLPPNAIKIGLMDEERRTSVNLRECIRTVRSRLAFINTGFLDRTGDEIHTSMHAGPMVRKGMMQSQGWIEAYEDGNVDTGLACGLGGSAQIGKGMWAAPDRMAAMLKEKIGHPLSGGSCAWVPSPTAATLHALHYHRVDVFTRQGQLASRKPRPLREMLTIPVAERPPNDEDRLSELENNAQGILGYVVRWVDQGVGCSKVPDIHDIGLMEDRATLRISSQHIANWLLHGVTSRDEVMEVMRRMSVVVDKQNAADPAYRPMSSGYDGPAFRAAIALVMGGAAQPAGYTEAILNAHRLEAKGMLQGQPSW